MRLTFIHPAIGHRRNQPYIKTWQMESLPVAVLAGLTPAGVEVRFYDDRLERVPFDEPTDVVALPIETYTANRAYQIASEYRKRGIPVIMGGFHATLLPEEVARFADALVTGEAEGVWAEVVDDARHGRLKERYHGSQLPLDRVRVNRGVLGGKRYLPIGLVETGRGCKFPCEFCAVQTFFQRTYRTRPIEDVVADIQAIRHQKKLFFFVDDNFAGDLKSGKPLLPHLAALNIRWITQMSINAAHDEDFLGEMRRAGCRGVLIGFESLDENNLAAMNKRFNSMKGGYSKALANLRRHGLAVYGTFLFGYEHDTPESFQRTVDFAIEEKLYIAAFNHLTPFPGTPLYQRLEKEQRLRYPAWWRNSAYRYNDLPFVPRQLSPEAVTSGCVGARRRFYGWKSIFQRSWGNRSDFFMWRQFFPINAMHRVDISNRNGYPLGDENWQGTLLERS